MTLSKDTVSTIALVTLALCAVGMTANTYYRASFSPLSAAADTLADGHTFARGGNRVGPINAPVTLVVFSDYQCPACRRLNTKLSGLRAEHPQTLAIVWRHYPIEGHPLARPAAVAAECAAMQGKFEDYHQTLFASQGKYDNKSWGVLARQVHIADTARFDSCVHGDSLAQAHIATDVSAGGIVGVDVTPTLILDNSVYLGLGDIVVRLKRRIAEAERAN